MSADETNKQPDPWASQMVPAQSYTAGPSSLGAATGSLLAFAQEAARDYLALDAAPSVDDPLDQLGADSIDAIEIQMAIEYRARKSTPAKYENKALCAHTLRDLVSWLDEANTIVSQPGDKRQPTATAPDGELR